MKIWIDDLCPAPAGYVWIKSVNKAKEVIEEYSNKLDFDNNLVDEIELIDINSNAGDYIHCGGNYINLLYWLEETNRNYSIHIHSQNDTEVESMRRIIKRNGWREV